MSEPEGLLILPGNVFRTCDLVFGPFERLASFIRSGSTGLAPPERFLWLQRVYHLFR